MTRYPNIFHPIQQTIQWGSNFQDGVFLASHNKRSVGFRHCKFRSSAGVSGLTLFQRGEKHSSDIGVINDSVLFYRICTSRKTKRGVLFNILSGRKETIRIKTNSESKTTTNKPDDKEAKFQNGYSAVCQKSSKIKGLAVFNRPNRRLYAYSSLGMPQDVSAIQNKGKSVPISGDSIWANVSSSNFHKYASSDLLIRALSRS